MLKAAGYLKYAYISSCHESRKLKFGTNFVQKYRCDCIEILGLT
jgi:hypothetical protein